MKRNSRLVEICRQYCVYFKPGKKEDLACMGLIVVEAISEKKGNVMQDALRGAAADKLVDGSMCPGTKSVLIRHICRICPFVKEDCDFAAEQEGAPPCGGFIYLGRLIDASAIRIDDLQDMH
jgi:hypothetical protein